MRTTLVIAVALATLPACKLRSLASLVTFEGEIEMTTSTGPTSAAPGVGMAAVFEMKGDKIRTEMKGMAGMSFVSITDAGAKKTWMIDNAAHTYTEMDLSAVTTPTPPKTTVKPKVVKTGRSDKVAGYSCDVYAIDDATYTPVRTEVCTASGLSMLALGLSNPFSAFSGGNDAWSEILGHGFPLRIVMLDPKSGTPMMKMEATRIERKSIPDADLRVPTGYTKTPSAFGGVPTTTATTTPTHGGTPL